MHTAWLPLLLLLAAAGVVVVAVRFQEPFINTFERVNTATGNKTRWESREIPFTCDQNSHRSTTLQVGDAFYDVNCHPPAWLFGVRHVGFVPKRTRLFTSNVFIVDTTTRFTNNATAFDKTIMSSPARRRLLWSPLDLLPSEEGANAFVCTATMWQVGDNCDGKSPPSTLDPDTLRALQNFSTALNNWQKNATNQFAIVFAHEQAIQDSVNGLKNVTQYLANQTKLLQANDDLLAARIDNFTLQTHNQFANLYNTTYKELKFLDHEISRLYNATNANFRAFADAVGEFKNTTLDEFKAIRKSIRLEQRATRRLTTLLYRARTNFDVRRQHSLQIASQKARCAAEGLVPFLHPDFPGADPLEGTLTSDQKTVIVDQFKVNWLNSTSPAPQVVVHQHVFTVSCNHQALVDASIAEIFWNDIGDLFKPGCSRRSGNIVDNCICWITINHDNKCNRGGSFQWKQVTTVQNPASYDLQASMCQGSITQGPWNGRVIDNYTEWGSYLTLLTDVDFSADPGLEYFQLVSAAMGPLAVQSIRDSKLIPIQLEALMTTDEFALTLPYAIYTELQIGFARALAKANDYERYIYGTLPNYLTCETIPNQYLDDGTTYQLDRCYLICVDPQTEPVFSVTLDTVQPLVTSVAYDGPADCSGAACTFAGRHIIAVEQTASAQAVTPFDALLPPSAGHVVVGEQFYAQGGSIYDVDQSTSISSVTAARRGEVTYLLQPIPGGYDLATKELGDYPPTNLVDGFLAFSGNLRPDARDAVYSLDITQTQLLTAGANGGRCDETDKSANWLCQLYDHFRTASDTDFKQGKWTLTPDQYSYTGTLSIVAGEVIQRVADLCPETDVVKYTDGSVDITLRNTLPLPVIVFVRVTTVPGTVAGGDICAVNTGGDVRYDLEPGQKYIQTLPRCGRQTLQVYRLSVGDVRIPCLSVPINITSDPLAAASVDRFRLGGSNSSFILDQVAVQSRQLIHEEGIAAAAASKYLDPSFNPHLTYIQRDLLYNQTFVDFLNGAKTRQDALNQLPATSTTDLIKHNQDEITYLADLINKQQIYVTQRLSDAEAIAQAEAAGLKKLQEESAILNAASQKLNEQLQKELDKVRSSTEQSCEDSMPWILRITHIASLICFIKRMLIWLLVIAAVCVGIYLLVWAAKWCNAHREASNKKAAQEARDKARADREAEREAREAKREEREDLEADRKSAAASKSKSAPPPPAAGQATSGKYARLSTRSGGWDSDEDDDGD